MNDAAPTSSHPWLVVAEQHGKCRLQHNLGRSYRPTAFSLHLFQSFEKAAHIHEDTGEFRADRRQCFVNALAG